MGWSRFFRFGISFRQRLRRASLQSGRGKLSECCTPLYSMEANIFTRFEFKFPFLFYHACFEWPESVKQATLEALEARARRRRAPYFALDPQAPFFCPLLAATAISSSRGWPAWRLRRRQHTSGDCSSRTPCGCCRRSCVAGSRGGGGIFSRRELPPMPTHPCVPQGRAGRARKAPTHAEGGAYHPPGRAHLHEECPGSSPPCPPYPAGMQDPIRLGEALCMGLH